MYRTICVGIIAFATMDGSVWASPEDSTAAQGTSQRKIYTREQLKGQKPLPVYTTDKNTSHDTLTWALLNDKTARRFIERRIRCVMHRLTHHQSLTPKVVQQGIWLKQLRQVMRSLYFSPISNRSCKNRLNLIYEAYPHRDTKNGHRLRKFFDALPDCAP